MLMVSSFLLSITQQFDDWFSGSGTDSGFGSGFGKGQAVPWFVQVTELVGWKRQHFLSNKFCFSSFA